MPAHGNINKATLGSPEYFIWLEKYLAKRRKYQKYEDNSNSENNASDDAVSVIKLNKAAAKAWLQAGPAAEAAANVLWRQAEDDGEKLPRISRVKNQLITLFNSKVLGEVSYTDLEGNYNRLTNIEGAEAKLFLGEGDDFILKLQNFMNNSETPADYLTDRIFLHNLLFPAAPYALEAFCLDTEEELPTPKFLVSQQIVVGRPAKQQEIDDYMSSLGFEQESSSSYSNGFLRVSDMNPRNALIDEDTGQFYSIDEVIERIN